MPEGKQFVRRDYFDRTFRDLRAGNTNVTLQRTTIINNPPSPEPVSSLYLPRLDVRRIAWALANPDSISGTLLEYGQDVAFSAGSAGRYVDAVSLWTYGQTGAAAGNFAYWRTENYYHFRTPHFPIWIARIKTGTDVSDMRLWAGISSDDLTNVDDPAAGTRVIAFRYSTGISNNFYVVTDDNATLTAVDTGVAVAADTEYTLMINVESEGSVKFYINGALVHTATADLPANTIDFGWNIYWATNEAVAKRIYISRQYYEAN